MQRQAAKRQINQKISKSDRVINLGTACKSEILIARPQQRGKAIVTQHLPQMRQNGSERYNRCHGGTLPQLCLYSVFAAQWCAGQNLIHAAFAFHGKQAAEAQRTQQPRQKCILYIAGAGKAEQFFISGFIDKPCTGILFSDSN